MLLVVRAGGPKLDPSKAGHGRWIAYHILVIDSLVHGPSLLFILMFKYLILTSFIYFATFAVLYTCIVNFSHMQK